MLVYSVYVIHQLNGLVIRKVTFGDVGQLFFATIIVVSGALKKIIALHSALCTLQSKSMTHILFPATQLSVTVD